MQITIHRGSHEIGGTCIRISTATTSILLDAGLPLGSNSKDLTASDLVADALVISHPHQDHCGLLDTLPTNMPVYIGSVAKNLLDSTRTFLRRQPLQNNFCHFKAWRPFSIGNITITLYLMDHSATDAYAFLIEAEGERIFYTGDFRGHGRKSVLFDNLLKKPPQNVDLLLMEGTMLQRNNSAFPDEDHVEAAIHEILKKQDNISFLISSSQNIDRIVSAYRASKNSGKTLVIDIYSAWVLEQLRQISSNIPTIDWNHVKVAFDKTRASVLFDPANRELFGTFVDRAIRNRVKGEQLRKRPDQYLMLLKMSSSRLIKSFARQEAPTTVIYSQWQGYLEQVEGELHHIAEMRAIRKGKYPGIIFNYAHTSGHAPLDDLQRLVQAIKPAKLLPIHTEFPDRYEELFGIGTVATDGVSIDVRAVLA